MRKTIALALVSLCFVACSKDKDSDVNKENISGSYKVTAATMQAGSAAPIDYLALQSPCEKDDIIKLNSDLTYNYVDAGTKCSPVGDDSGVWSVPSNTQISIDGQVSTIKSFDGHTLVISDTELIGSVNYVSVTTLVKQ